ncbi:MAG: hypothetical protein JXR37_10890 [Kiritimatiellae bacterium]|nr:hypothetical protein [Kiritimatiellia bacterium]
MAFCAAGNASTQPWRQPDLPCRLTFAPSPAWNQESRDRTVFVAIDELLERAGARPGLAPRARLHALFGDGTPARALPVNLEKRVDAPNAWGYVSWQAPERAPIAYELYLGPGNTMPAIDPKLPTLNLVRNPSFEEQTEGWPIGWQPLATSNLKMDSKRYGELSAPAISGEHSLRLHSDHMNAQSFSKWCYIGLRGVPSVPVRDLQGQRVGLSLWVLIRKGDKGPKAQIRPVARHAVIQPIPSTGGAKQRGRHGAWRECFTSGTIHEKTEAISGFPNITVSQIEDHIDYCLDHVSVQILHEPIMRASLNRPTYGLTEKQAFLTYELVFDQLGLLADRGGLSSLTPGGIADKGAAGVSYLTRIPADRLGNLDMRVQVFFDTNLQEALLSRTFTPRAKGVVELDLARLGTWRKYQVAVALLRKGDGETLSTSVLEFERRQDIFDF